MKQRSDFVSNSSSSSFMILDDPKRVYTIIRNKTAQYIEFAKYINYYNRLVMIKGSATDQLDDYIKQNPDCGIKESTISLSEAISHKLDPFGYEYKVRENQKETNELLRHEYYIIDSVTKEDTKKDYKEIKQLIIDSGKYKSYFLSTWAVAKSCYIDDFLRKLNEESVNQFLDSVLMVFNSQQLGEYDSADQRPAELMIFEKYNRYTPQVEVSDLPF